MPSDENADQSTVANESPDQPPIAECCTLIVKKKKTTRRNDVGHLHAVRHAVLSRYPLEALRRLGEDTKALRRLERRFRADLKPQGATAEVLFDRFWSSYLRCLLAARTEANVFLRQTQYRRVVETDTKLIHGDLPTLVVEQTEDSATPAPLEQEMLRELALVQRYDRHFGKEMYRALAFLLILRRSGESGLEESFANLFGVEG